MIWALQLYSTSGQMTTIRGQPQKLDLNSNIWQYNKIGTCRHIPWIECCRERLKTIKCFSWRISNREMSQMRNEGRMLTWRRKRALRGSGVRPPIWVVERKAYPRVGLMGEFLLSNLKEYFREEIKLCPSCLLIDLADIWEGSVKVRHVKL